MAGDVTPYTDLITSEHFSKPKFMQMVAASLQPIADMLALYQQMPILYDIDSAVGTQLDVLGQWIGITRLLDNPLAGVYFAFDTANVGWDQGVWQGEFDPSSGLVSLPDDFYRILLKVRIINNHWDGSKPQAYLIASTVFAQIGYTFFMEDKSDMTMNLGLVGSGPPTPIAQGLLASGKFNIKPAGVHIAAYLSQSVPGPIFAFDLDTPNFAGFDTGGWATVVQN